MGAPMAAAIAAIARILFRMVFSFAMGRAARGLSHACAQSLPIHAAPHRSPRICDATLQLLAAMHHPAEPVEAKSVSYRGTAATDKISASIRAFPTSPGEISMTLTVAHISPIMSVIAGLLILIMPRLLNLVVAIFLILNGLIGLGLLKWLHM
jgi:hypothetical protein